ncbi:hypothetical protein [Streptomyces sp. NPDC051546]|uniref:hypothetical protein n=1 Tax=Streptomyces sp. NPDC051546 TaxID=3365655 RepID=UPI00379BA0C2
MVFAADHIPDYIAQALVDAEAQHPGLAGEAEAYFFSPYADTDLGTETTARAALAAFTYEGFRFDTSDWDLTQYNPWFLTSCVALDWAVNQYDTALATAS